MTSRPRVDWFEVFSGVAAVIGGLVMLGLGASAGWSILILGDGLLVLGALLLVTRRRRLDGARRDPGGREPRSKLSTVK